MREWPSGDIKSTISMLIPKILGVFLVLVTVASFNFFFFLYDENIHFLAPKGSTHERISEITEEYRIGEAAVVRYFSYMAHTFSGDYYDSSAYLRGTSISSFIYSCAARSLLLVGLSLTLAVMVGVTWGRSSARRAGTLIGSALHLLAAAVFAFPMIALASYAFRVNHDIGLGLPPSGNGYGEGLLGVVEHAALPLFCLTAFGTGYVALVARAGCNKAGRGDGSDRLLAVFASRNLLTWYLIPLLFSGLIVVEQVYAYDGLMSTFLLASAFYHDVPLTMACFFVLSAIVLSVLLVFRLIVHASNLKAKSSAETPRPDTSSDISCEDSELSPLPRLSLSRAMSAAKALAKEFVKSKSGTAALSLFIIILLAGLLADVISISRPIETRVLWIPEEMLQPPSLSHPLGTDVDGDDLYSLNLYASRFDLLLVLTTSLLSLLIGVSIAFLRSSCSLRRRKRIRRVIGWLLGVVRDFALAVPIAALMLILIVYPRGGTVGFVGCILLFTAFMWFWGWSILVSRVDGRSSPQSPQVVESHGIRSSLQNSVADFRRSFWSTLAKTVFFTKFAVLLVFVVGGILGRRFPVPEFLRWEYTWEQLLYEAYLRGGFFENWWLAVPPIVGIVLLAVSSYFILNTLEGILARRARRDSLPVVAGRQNHNGEASATSVLEVKDVDSIEHVSR